MKYLVLTFRKPEFNAQVIPAHYEFLGALREQGVLEQAGPFTDRSGGAYVIRAANFDEARSTAEQDPLHRQGCSTVITREWDAK